MYQRYKERFGTAGLMIGAIALILALGGTALAASGALTGKQKKEVTKIAKKYAGKNGATGATGPAGAAGKDGANGTNGSNGTNGVSATTETFAGINGSCQNGGVIVKSATAPVNVCNGKNGTNGTNGTFSTEPLPQGETLTGVWGAFANTTGKYTVPISYPIKVNPAPAKAVFVDFSDEFAVTWNPADGSSVVLIEEDAAAIDALCPGDAGNPTAEPGVLCIYTANEATELFSVFTGVSGTPKNYSSSDPSSGAIFTDPLAAGSLGTGTWAVTAE